jgi:hypothetical protein
MSGSRRPLARLALGKRVRLEVELHPNTATLLDVLAEHIGKSRDETIADALRCLFVTLPRPGEGPDGKH